jgi:hypothetical protein
MGFECWIQSLNYTSFDFHIIIDILKSRNLLHTPTMFDSFIKPRAEPHLTEPGDAGKTDWVMRNPGMFPSLLH